MRWLLDHAGGRIFIGSRSASGAQGLQSVRSAVELDPATGLIGQELLGNVQAIAPAPTR